MGRTCAPCAVRIILQRTQLTVESRVVIPVACLLFTRISRLISVGIMFLGEMLSVVVWYCNGLKFSLSDALPCLLGFISINSCSTVSLRIKEHVAYYPYICRKLNLSIMWGGMLFNISKEIRLNEGNIKQHDNLL